MADPVAETTPTPAPVRPGAEIIKHAMDAGFDPKEINDWKANLRDQQFGAGFSPEEIANYWGENDNAPMAKATAAISSGINALSPEQRAKLADNPMEAFLAGLQTSAPGLAIHGPPTTALAENPSLANKVAAASGQVLGDLPVMALGFALGAPAGGAAGGAAGGPVGAAVGGALAGGAAGNALPELMREILMDQYAHPEGYKTWEDFWARAQHIAGQTGKAALVGGLANMLGGVVGSKFAGAGVAASTGANLTTQIATATAVGSALEGKVPSYDDFLTNAVVMVGLHSAGVLVGAANRFVATPKTEQVAENLRDIYAKTGMNPTDAIRAAANDPAVLGEVLAPRNAAGVVTTPALRQLAAPEPPPHTPESQIKPPEPYKPPTREEANPAVLERVAGFARGNAVPGGPSPVDKLDPEFASRIDKMTKAMPDNIRAKFTIGSGFRSPEREAQVYREQHPDQTPPEHSRHSDGMAADIGKDPEVIQWITNHPEYGVGFPLSHLAGEANHMEPIGPNGERMAGYQGHGNHVETVDDNTVKMFATLENSGDNATSPKGAFGRYQIMPDTARGYGFDPSRLNDPEYAKTAAKAIVSDLAKKFDGNLTDMFVAYNAGPARARAWIAGGRKMGDLPVETQHYLERAEAKGFTHGSIVWEQANRALHVQGDTDWAPREGELIPPGETLADALAKVAEPGGGGGREPPRIGGPPEDDLTVPPGGPKKTTGWGYTDEVLLDRMSDIIAPGKPEGLLPDWLNPRKVLAAFQSQLAPARAIDREIGLKRGQVGIEDMARQIYAAKERANYALQIGTLRLGQNTIEQGSNASYKEAYKAVKQDGGTAKGFIEYRIAQRTVEKAAQEVKTGADLDAARQVAGRQSIRAKYERGAQILRESKDALVDYARDSGLFSAKGAAAMKDLNRDHIVFRRVMEPGYNPPGVGGNRMLRPRSPTRKMRGGDQQIVDPLTAEIDNYHTFIAMADRNRAVGNIIALAERSHLRTPNDPDTKLLWHDRTEGSPSKPMDLFDEQGKPIPPEKQAGLEPFLAERTSGAGLKPDEFPYYRDGKREIWKARDPELAALMRTPPTPEFNPVKEIAQRIAGFARLGIVSTPDFLIRAVTHGQLASSAFSEGGRKLPFLDIAHGMAHVLGKDELFREAARNGALAGAMTDLDVNYLRKSADKLFDDTSTSMAVANSFRHPLEALRALHSMIDASARVGAFDRLQNKGLSDLKAASLTRTAYLDHAEGRAAAWLRSWASTVPFMEIGFKDVGQVAAAFRRNPVGATLTAATVLTMPTMVNYALNYLADLGLEEKDRYSQLPRWMRDMYWVTPHINGVRLKIMRPYVGGFLFSTLPERVLEGIFGTDDGASKELWRTFVAQAVPPFMPTGITPILEQTTGFSFFEQRNLIPASLEHLSAYMQYKPDTTEVAKAFARVLGPSKLDWADVSPIVMENYVRAWGGSLPWQLLHVLDKPFEPPGRPSEMADLPFMGSFFVRNQHALKSVEDFYEESRAFTNAHGDVKKALEEGNPGLVSNYQFVEAAVKLDAFREAMHRMSGVLVQVNRSGMTKDEKLKYNDAIASGMLATAKGGLQVIEEVKKLR